MVRLLRLMPQLLILVKAIGAALVTVSLTLALLVAVLYVSSIAFCQMTAKSELGDRKFGKIHNAMNTLFLAGALLDDITGMVQEFMTAEDYLSLVMFYFFVLFAAITIMNMLIGVVCEVITATAAAEKEGIQVACVKEALQTVLIAEKILGHDEMTKGQISKAHFFQLLQNTDAVRALDDVGVEATMLVDFADVIFEEGEGEQHATSLFDSEDVPEEKTIMFSDLMDVVLQLRGSNVATVKDILNLQKHLKIVVKSMLKQMVEDLSNPGKRLSAIDPSMAKADRPPNSLGASAAMSPQSSESRDMLADQCLEKAALADRMMVRPGLPKKQAKMTPLRPVELENDANML